MAAWRRAIELSLGDADTAKLRSIAQSRTEPASRVERAVTEGPLAALDDRPRPGREPSITIEAKAWLVDLACRKAKDLGYPHELWRHGFSLGTPASMGPRKGMRASPAWRRARCAKSSTRKT